jgi:hypothetical protein
MDPQFQELELRLGKRFDEIEERLDDITSHIEGVAWSVALLVREHEPPAKEGPKARLKRPPPRSRK